MNNEEVLADIEEMRLAGNSADGYSFENELRTLFNLKIDVTAINCKVDLGAIPNFSEMLWEVVEIVCRFRQPQCDQFYYMAEISNDTELSYYSISNFQSGIESRTPRRLAGDDAKVFYAKHNVVYVIDRSYEAEAWLLRWGGRALVSGNHLQDLIEQYE